MKRFSLREKEMVFLHKKLRFLCASLGLTISFIIFSLLHEKLVKTEYGDVVDDTGTEHKENFYYFQSLLAVLCLVNSVIGGGKLSKFFFA